MLFPENGGADDGRSIFVAIKNTTDRTFEARQLVMIPRDAELKEDDRYIASCWVKTDRQVIAPGDYGIAKLVSAEFFAD